MAGLYDVKDFADNADASDTSIIPCRVCALCLFVYGMQNSYIFMMSGIALVLMIAFVIFVRNSLMTGPSPSFALVFIFDIASPTSYIVIGMCCDVIREHKSCIVITSSFT